MKADYDVVVVGAGMVGATLTLALSEKGLRVAVIEACEPQLEWPAGSHDLRVSAVTEASGQIFRSLGVWQTMVVSGVSPFSDMHVWDAGGGGEIHFDCAGIGAASLGHIIENRVIQAALVGRLQRQGRADWFCPDTVDAFDVSEERVSITLASGGQLSARLLAAADGGRSRIREMAAIETRGWRYDQTAVVATVKTEKPHQETAWQRFLETGPLAFLPLSDGQSSIVWSTSPEQAASLLTLDDEVFCAELAKAFDYRLGAVTATGSRAAFPLQLQHAKNYVLPRLALVGDAAHTIHPLAGQGVNLGLLDAATLAEVLAEASAMKRDPGAMPVLRRYERWRKGDNLLTMAVMDGFKRLFGAQSAPLRWLRNRGLSLVDSMEPVKHQIMYQAMGFRGDLPQIARPLADKDDMISN